MPKPDFLKKFDVLDVLSVNPIVHGHCYFHVGNSGVTFKLIDEGHGPTLVISSSAFGNLQNEAKFHLAPEGLEVLADFFRKMSTEDYTEVSVHHGETPNGFEGSDGRNVGDVLQQAATNYSPEMTALLTEGGWTVEHKNASWFSERWKTAGDTEYEDAEEVELEFEWHDDIEMPFLKNDQDKHREVEVGIHFDLNEMGEDGMGKLYEAQRLLGELGISFDSGAGGGERDWEWDWSLKGPVKVTFRRFVDQYKRNRYWRDSPAGKAEKEQKNKEYYENYEENSKEWAEVLARVGNDEGRLFARVAHTLHLVGLHDFSACSVLCCKR